MAKSLQVKLIQSLRKHLKSGYYENTDEVLMIIGAVEQGKIRVIKEEDHLDFDDCHGDIFCPVTNHDICPNKLKREETNAKARFRRVGGAFTFASEFWNGREWDDMLSYPKSDCSIGGFVGDDFFGSGYEWQVMQEALDYYNKQEFDKDGKLIDKYDHTA